MSSEIITYSLFFSAALKYAIKECELKDKEAAEIIGVKPPMINKLKRGETNVGLDTAARIARVFGYELTDFLILGREIMNGGTKSNNITEKSNFALYLNRALAVTGLTQKELARKAGIREASISEFSNGIKAPSFGNIEKIAEALELSLSQFFSIAEDVAQIESRLKDGGNRE